MRSDGAQESAQKNADATDVSKSGRKEVRWTWEIDLTPIIGRYATLETKDGTIREGKITGVAYNEFVLNGQTVGFPDRIELNGDPADYIEFNHLARFDIQDL